MCQLTTREKTILINLGEREKGLIASKLGVQTDTIDVHLSRIRRKRERAKKFIAETERFKSVLYPKRKGE